MKTHKAYTFLILILLIVRGAQGQKGLESFECPVQWGTTLLSEPFRGGLNAPQFQEADLNHDGVADLVVFDRAGDVVLPYLRLEENGETRFVFARSYASYFPRYTSWGLFRDYDLDGISDLYTWSSNPAINGVRVFRGRYQNDTLTFDIVPVPGSFENVLLFPLTNGTKTQIYIAFDDIPAVDDVDNDGDLDIVTFSPGGGYVEWYRNMSVEKGWGSDSLAYQQAETCWGKFYESGLGEWVDLSLDPNKCSNLLGDGTEVPVELRHAGSTLLTLDTDGDGDRELLLGDISFSNINRLVNGGTPSQAWMNAQDTFFPKTDIPVYMPVFPASFLADLDHDGVRDLIVAPNSDSGSQDTANVWFYKNTGTNALPDFKLQDREFLVERMLDAGTGARPCFIDIDGDGLKDLLIGNTGFFTPIVLYTPSVVYLRNTGTAGQPAFTLMDLDYLGLSAYGQNFYLGFTPASGDLDGDGDTDLVIGEINGTLFFVENTAGSGNPVSFKTPVPQYQGIGIGSHSVPQIIDVNGDGLMDLLIGEKIGNVNYYQNQGQPGAPSFNPDAAQSPNSAVYGKIDMRKKGFTSGYSSPWMFRTSTGLNLVIGSNSGEIRHYQAFDGTATLTFPVLDSLYTGYRDGFKTHPVLEDLDNDGLYEIIIGNQRGGLTAYRTGFADIGTGLILSDPGGVRNITANLDPSRQTIVVETPAGSGTCQASLWDMTGRLLNQRSIHGTGILPLDPGLQGMVILAVQGDREFRSFRFILTE